MVDVARPRRRPQPVMGYTEIVPGERPFGLFLEVARGLCLGATHDPILHGPAVLRLIEDLDSSISDGVTPQVRRVLVHAYLRALDDLLGWTPADHKGESYNDRSGKAETQLQSYLALHFTRG